MYAKEIYVNATKGYQFGDSGLYETYTDNVGKLFRDYQKEFGRCTGNVFIDTKDGVKKIGWVFEKMMQYEDARRKDDVYLREVWVELHNDKPDVVTTEHYHSL